MRFLPTGLTMVAAIAVAATSAFADADTATSSNPAGAWMQPAPASENAAAAARMRPHRRYVQRIHRFDPRWRSSADHMANRLNRQELIGGGAVYRSTLSPYDGRYGPSPYSASGY